jgi:hypothetical protein
MPSHRFSVHSQSQGLSAHRVEVGECDKLVIIQFTVLRFGVSDFLTEPVLNILMLSEEPEKTA